MLVGITGFIGSGKNTVATHLVYKAGYTQDSFAASLKDACSVIFSWDRKMMEGDTNMSRTWREQVDPWWEEKLGIPNFTPRLAMQLIGTDALRNYFNPDIWLLTVERRYETRKGRPSIVITDARFPNEINMIKELGGKIINVSLDEPPAWYDIAYAAVRGDYVSAQRMADDYSHIHTSEWAWLSTDPDYTIMNTGTREELEEKVWDIHLQLAGVK